MTPVQTDHIVASNMYFGGFDSIRKKGSIRIKSRKKEHDLFLSKFFGAHRNSHFLDSVAGRSTTLVEGNRQILHKK